MLQGASDERTGLLPDRNAWDTGERRHVKSPTSTLRARRHRRSLRKDVWTVLRFRQSIQHRSTLQRASYVFEVCILTLIMANVLVAMGISSLIDGVNPENTLSLHSPFCFDFFNCFARLTWMIRPMSIIDLAVLIPFYIELFFKYQLTPSNRGLLTLRGLRLLRVLSFLRLERSYSALKNLRTILSKKKEELGLVTYMTAVIVLTSSTTIFFFENPAQPEVFSSVGVSAWWAVETITSLGYGDIVPITSGGRMFSSIIALWGIILFTIPGAVLSSGFVEVMLEKQKEKNDALHAALHRTLSREVFTTMSARDLNNMFLNVFFTPAGQYDSPRSEPSPSFGLFMTPAQTQIERLQDKVDQLTKTQEKLQTQLSMQEAHLHAILKLLEASQPRARRVELASEPPPFSEISFKETHIHHGAHGAGLHARRPVRAERDAGAAADRLLVRALLHLRGRAAALVPRVAALVERALLLPISEKLNIPYDIAGVTFLAFGNGAPDVFSAIAAYSSGVSEAGINELLGGAMFVSTVVVGCVAIASAVKVERWPFSRDVSALLGSLVLLLLVASALDTRDASNEAAVLLFLIAYGVYVSSVLLPECLSRYRIARAQQLSQLDDMRPVAAAGGVLSAFWHALSPRTMGTEDGASQPRQPYVFVTRQHAELTAGGKHGVYELSSPKKQPAVQFTNRVYEDHFQDDSVIESLSSPLITDEDRIEHGDALLDGSDATSKSLEQIGFTTGAGILQSAYWRHLRWRWSLKRRIVGVFYGDDTLLVKALSVPQACIVLIRDMTIPLLDQEAWSRPLATISPITVPLLILLTSGCIGDTLEIARHDVALWQITLVCGCVAAVIVSFTTHRSHPPKSTLYSFFFLSLAFSACVCWIYAVANELMALLVAVGYITHASNSLLGLTVLSWGNSVGDLITNVSVARAGFPQMAIAGCFGGPVFNILLGLGVPMSFAYFRGQAVEFALDAHAQISLVFLFVTLSASCFVFRRHHFRCPPWYGKLLVVFYLVYTIINLVIAFRMFLAGEE
ncbi:Ca2 :cation antiporter, partial [Globisporangium splendens]